MKVSIITVVYNGEKYLEQTIQSVINQTYKNIEYIVIDGGSTDRTMDIIKQYEDKIDYWVSERDSGIYDAMNKGISHATGDLIGLINSDDFYSHNTVELVVEAYELHGDSCIYHGLMNIMNEEGMEIGILNPVPESPFFMLTGCSIAHPTTFIPKKLYDIYGGYDLDLKLSADYDFLLRLVRHSVKPVFINQVLAHFREGGASSDIFRTAYEAHQARVRNGINIFISLLFLFRVYLMFYTKKLLIRLKLERIIDWYRNTVTQSHRRSS